MSVVGQQLGLWEGNWLGATTTDPNRMYGTARGTSSCSGLLSVVEEQATRSGGDDAFHKHPGWNKAAWKRKQKREDAIEQTIEATYRSILGIAPAPVVVAELKAEIRKSEEIARLDYTQEMKLIEWLSAQISAVQQKRYLDELDDEEALLLLI